MSSPYDPFNSLAEYKTTEFDPPEEVFIREGNRYPLPPVYVSGGKMPAKGNPYDVSRPEVDEYYEDGAGNVYTTMGGGELVPVVSVNTETPKAGGLFITLGLLAGVIVLGVIAGNAEKK